MCENRTPEPDVCLTVEELGGFSVEAFMATMKKIKALKEHRRKK